MQYRHRNILKFNINISGQVSISSISHSKLILLIIRIREESEKYYLLDAGYSQNQKTMESLRLVLLKGLSIDRDACMIHN